MKHLVASHVSQRRVEQFDDPIGRLSNSCEKCMCNKLVPECFACARTVPLAKHAVHGVSMSEAHSIGNASASQETHE